MRGHHQLMSKFLETHRAVMAGFLGGGMPLPAPAPGVPEFVAHQPMAAAPVRAPEPVRAPATVPVAATQVQAPATPPPVEVPVAIATAAPSVLTLEAITNRLLELVSGLTGYPPQMLNLDLNLEADLGIDSIKRVEIFAALQNADLVPASDGGNVEDFSQLNTLRKIAAWVHEQASGATTPAAPALTPAKSQPAAFGQIAAPAPVEKKEPTLTRMLVTAVDAPLPALAALATDGSYIVTDDGGGIAPALAQRLEQLGARTQVIDATAAYQWIERLRSQGDRIAGLVHLAPLAHWPVDTDFEKRLDVELRSIFHLARGLETDLPEPTAQLASSPPRAWAACSPACLTHPSNSGPAAALLSAW